MIIEIDGKAIEGDTDLDTLLNHKVGVLVQLTVRPAAGGPAVKEIISPTSYANVLKLAKSAGSKNETRWCSGSLVVAWDTCT